MARKFPQSEILELRCSDRGGALRVLKHLQHFHSGIVSGDAADRSTTAGTGAADEDVWEFSFDAPGSSGFRGFGKGESQSAVKNVASVMAEFQFYVERSFGFKARFAVVGRRKTILDRIEEIIVEAVEAFSGRLDASGFVVRIE